MDKFSKRYNKWFRCLPGYAHKDWKKLYKFGNYWYRPDKDIMIHNDIIDDYINNCLGKNKKFRKEAYCRKNGIELK